MRFAFSLAIGLFIGLSARAEEPKAAYPPLPEAFSSFGAAVLDGHVYVYGGHIAKTHNYSTEAVTGKFRRLNLAKPTAWEELPAGPGLQGLALVAHGGKIYRIGGMQPRNMPGDKSDNHSVATVAVFDPKVGKWADLADMPAPRSSHDAIVVGDLLVVVGGWNLTGRSGSSAFHDTTLVMDLSQPSPAWKSVPQPFKRRALNVAAVEGKVVIVGGMNADQEVEKTVDVFDAKDQRWSTVAALPGIKRNGFAPAVCAQRGQIFASPADGKVYRLSPKFDAWHDTGDLHTKRIVHRIVPLGADKILVLGGASPEGNVSNVEAIEPKVAPPAADGKS